MTELYPLDVARLVFGLRENSRLLKKLHGNRYELKDEILAVISDRLAWLCWSKTEDAQKGRNKPKSLYEAMQGKETKKNKKNVLFETVDDFEEARQKIIEGSREQCQT